MADGASEIPALTTVVTASVRNEGDKQFIVFPEGFRIDADEVSVRRDGEALVLEPLATSDPPQTDQEWAAFWAQIDHIRGEELLAQPEREPPEDSDTAG